MPTRPNIPPGPHSRTQAQNYNKVIEKANAYDRYSNIPPAVISAALGSRAFANARGSQAGLNIPGSTKATQSKGYYPPVKNPTAATPVGNLTDPSGPQSLTTAGLTVDEGIPGYTPAVADLTKNPYPGYYDALLSYVQKNADARPAEYAYTGEVFKRNQDIANNQMYNMYSGSRSGADASATALGVDPNAISAARDIAMRQSQENSDQALAGNLAWLSKMGILSKQQAEASLNMYAGEKATKSAGWDAAEQQRVADANLQKLQQLFDLQKAATAAASKGSGGGKKKGSGGSSSSSGSSNVTQTDTVQFSGADQAIVDELIASGQTDAAALYINQHNATMGNAEVKANQKAINDLTAQNTIKGRAVPKASPYFPASTLQSKFQTPAYKAAQAAALKLPLYKAILPKVVSTSGLYLNPYSKTSVTTKGKAK